MTDSVGPMSPPAGMMPISGPGVLGGPAAAGGPAVAPSPVVPGDPAALAPAELIDEIPRVSALGEAGMAWASRLIWVVCIGVYLTAFVGGILARGSELLAMERAVGFTLIAALLGKFALALLARATVAGEPVPLATEEGKLGSLVSLVPVVSVPQQEIVAAKAA